MHFAASDASLDMVERHEPIHKTTNQLDSHQGLNNISEETSVRDDSNSIREKREALLDNVVTTAYSRGTPTVNSTLPSGPKWKKTDKDHSIDILTKDSSPINSRPSLGNGRGERKAKAKPKQKIAQLSASRDGLERETKTTSISPSEVKPEVELGGSGNTRDLSKEGEDNLFANLPLQGNSIDELDLAAGFGGQGQDIDSWFTVDDDSLPDDLIGLEIPMDDLADLNF